MGWRSPGVRVTPGGSCTGRGVDADGLIHRVQLGAVNSGGQAAVPKGCARAWPGPAALPRLSAAQPGSHGYPAPAASLDCAECEAKKTTGPLASSGRHHVPIHTPGMEDRRLRVSFAAPSSSRSGGVLQSQPARSEQRRQRSPRRPDRAEPPRRRGFATENTTDTARSSSAADYRCAPRTKGSRCGLVRVAREPSMAASGQSVESVPECRVCHVTGPKQRRPRHDPRGLSRGNESGCQARRAACVNCVTSCSGAGRSGSGSPMASARVGVSRSARVLTP